jgi:hypothetical protein
MPDLSANILEYYADQGIVSDPQDFAYMFENLPNDIPSLCQLIQGVMIHAHWIERYGVRIPKERRENESNLRAVWKQLKRIGELDVSPLTIARPNENKLIGTCRDYATLLAAILRHQGVPARARCGFGIYFLPNHYEDHWICECWKADENRWVMVDAQLDSMQKEILGVQFDTADMPPGMFITGGQAWQLCRSGKANPDKFGIFDYHGLDFVAANVVRDILALNKIEILPWDNWPLIVGIKEFSPEHLCLIDQIAEITLAGNETFQQVRLIYENTPSLRASIDWQP